MAHCITVSQQDVDTGEQLSNIITIYVFCFLMCCIITCELTIILLQLYNDSIRTKEPLFTVLLPFHDHEWSIVVTVAELIMSQHRLQDDWH